MLFLYARGKESEDFVIRLYFPIWIRRRTVYAAYAGLWKFYCPVKHRVAARKKCGLWFLAARAEQASQCPDSVVYVHDLAGNANDIEVNHFLGSVPSRGWLSRKFRARTNGRVQCTVSGFSDFCHSQSKVRFSPDVKRMTPMLTADSLKCYRFTKCEFNYRGEWGIRFQLFVNLNRTYLLKVG